MAPKSVLLAAASSGQCWVDPSEDLLFMLMEDMVRDGRGYLLIERLDSVEPQRLKVLLHDGWIGMRKVEGGCVAIARTKNMREAHSALTRWAFRLGDEGIDNVQWGTVPSGSL
jgi:hypothetical protein